MIELSLYYIEDWLNKFGQDNGKSESAQNGLGGITFNGEYYHRVNGGPWERADNLVVNEGISHILNVALGTKAKTAKYYLALARGALLHRLRLGQLQTSRQWQVKLSAVPKVIVMRHARSGLR